MRKQAAETLSCYVGMDPTGEKLELLWNRHHNEAAEANHPPGPWQATIGTCQEPEVHLVYIC